MSDTPRISMQLVLLVLIGHTNSPVTAVDLRIMVDKFFHGKSSRSQASIVARLKRMRDCGLITYKEIGKGNKLGLRSNTRVYSTTLEAAGTFQSLDRLWSYRKEFYCQ